MRNLTIASTILALALMITGCGQGSGIQPGIPADTTPVNPTPDMGPMTKPEKTK